MHVLIPFIFILFPPKARPVGPSYPTPAPVHRPILYNGRTLLP